MKTRTTRNPMECNFCSAKGTVIDGPMNGSTTWAHACEKCAVLMINTNYSGCIKLEYRPASDASVASNTGKTVKSVIDELDMFDSVIDVECPLCGEIRGMEPDAVKYNCECGAKVLIPCLI